MDPDLVPARLAEEASAMVKEDPYVWQKAAHRLTHEQTHITSYDEMLPSDLLQRVADTHPNKEYKLYARPDKDGGYTSSHRGVATDFLPVRKQEYGEYTKWVSYEHNPSFREVLALPTFSAECDDLPPASDVFIEFMALADLDNNEFVVVELRTDFYAQRCPWHVVIAADLGSHRSLADAAQKLSESEQGDDGYIIPIAPLARRDFSERVESGAGLRRPPGFPPLAEMIEYRKRIADALSGLRSALDKEWRIGDWENRLRQEGDEEWADRVARLLHIFETATRKVLEIKTKTCLELAETG